MKTILKSKDVFLVNGDFKQSQTLQFLGHSGILFFSKSKVSNCMSIKKNGKNQQIQPKNCYSSRSQYKQDM